MVGKHERSVSPALTNTNVKSLLSGVLSERSQERERRKDFLVATSRLKTTMAEQEQLSRSLRKLENQMMRTSHSFKNYYQLTAVSPLESL
jgi:7,8-dihydro-6-hydroxymethylpterin-pyrophosphokinase